MGSLIKLLDGKKSYLVIVAIVGVNVAKIIGLIDTSTYTAAMATLIPAAGVTFRLAIGKAQAAAQAVADGLKSLNNKQ